MASQRAVIQNLADIGALTIVHKYIAGDDDATYLWAAGTGCPYYYRFIDAIVVKCNGAAGAQTLTISNQDAAAITDAIDINDGDKTISRPTTIDNAYYEIKPGGDIKLVLSTEIGNQADVYVMLMRVA